MTVKPIVIGALCIVKRFDTRTGGFINKRTSGDHPNYCLFEIGQNSKKRPADLKLAVTQTPMEQLSNV